MKKTFYEKVGRRYVPVLEYDEYVMDGLPYGDHLISVYPGGQSTRRIVDANHVALIAAARVAEDAMAKELIKASEIRLDSRRERQLTPEERAAWDNLVAVFGEGARYLEWPSARDVAEAGVNALEKEATKLMKHDAVRASYEHFITVCKLCKEMDNANS